MTCVGCNCSNAMALRECAFCFAHSRLLLPYFDADERIGGSTWLVLGELDPGFLRGSDSPCFCHADDPSSESPQHTKNSERRVFKKFPVAQTNAVEMPIATKLKLCWLLSQWITNNLTINRRTYALYPKTYRCTKRFIALTTVAPEKVKWCCQRC